MNSAIGKSEFLATLGIVFITVFISPGPGAAADSPLAQEDFPLPDSVRDSALVLREAAINTSDAYAIVQSLTTEVGHRSAGSSGDKAAIAWALDKFKQLGFANIRAEPVAVPHWDRGSTEVTIVSPNSQQLVATAIGGSIGTGETGIEGPVLSVATLDDLKALPSDTVAGKIVYIGDRMERSRDALGYVAAVQKRGLGPSEAASKGALALLIRSAGSSAARFAHTGAMKKIPGARPIPSLALANADADLLELQLASGKPVSIRIQLTARHLADEQSANVIGEIRGSKHPNEIILLGAHLDSWDVGTGALDDGAGVAIVMEAARLIGQMRPRPLRTIRVVLYANEEFGLSGGKAYAEKYADSLADHVLAMEADLGADTVFRFESRVTEEDLPKIRAMHTLLAPLNIELGENTAYGGADIAAIRDLGVPVLGPRQDASRYFDYHHTANDTLDKVDLDGIRQNTAVYAVLAYLAAEIDTGFERIPIVPPAP